MMKNRLSLVVTLILSVIAMTASSLYSLEATYTYDSLSRLISAAYTEGANTTTIDYQYDPLGNILSYSVKGGSATTGSVVVNPNPDSINAPWTLTGPAGFVRNESGYKAYDSLAPGNYTLTWKDVAGWNKPSPAVSTQYLKAGSAIAFNGTYTMIDTADTIVIDAEPNIANAPWTVTGPNGYTLSGNGDRVLAGMAAGSYTIAWGAAAGWKLPAVASETKSLAAGGSQTFTGAYTTIPVVDVNPASLNFGYTIPGVSRDLTLTVRNLGTATFSGSVTTAKPFSVASGATFTLAPNQSQAVTVRYAPTQSGNHQGTLAISGIAATVPLWGNATGLPPSQAGSVFGWGNDDSGQLGDGVDRGGSTPIPVQGLNGVVAVAAGEKHTVALKADGTVWAWGDGQRGQLGNGSYNSSYTPVQVPGIANVVAIAAGAYHTLALKSDKTVWAWGDGWNGQVGNGAYGYITTPVQVLNLTGVISIAAGAHHTLALKSDGTVWAWGENWSGELGNDAYGNVHTPVQVQNLNDVIAIAGGSNHSVALKSNKTVWAWGANYYGQLGDGTTTQRPAPTPVLNLTDVTAIAAGDYHTVALKTDQTVWAWGAGGNGQLGNGTWMKSSTPVQSNIGQVKAISAGKDHTVAVRTGGTVHSWGLNDLGQLGDGTWDNRRFPGPALNIGDVGDVKAGQCHVAALKSDGTVWTWGSNSDGQLGNGSVSIALTPIAVSNLTGASTVAAGANHSIALMPDKTLRAWGRNSAGQLGDGTTTNRTTPVQVQGLTGVAAVAGGDTHTIALRESDGTVWAWGYNAGGVLGNGTWDNSNAPVQVQNLDGMSAVAAGHWISLAAKQADGSVWAWGTAGLLGNGTWDNSNTPVQVQNLTGVAAVGAGESHAVALKSDGTVWAWGRNSSGELGNGTNTESNVPVPVQNLTGVTAIAVGAYHTLALKSDGTVWGWGRGNDYQLGLATYISYSNKPVQIPNFTGVVAIAAGARHSLALKSDGTVWAWGNGLMGELGGGYASYYPQPTLIQGIGGVTGIAAGRRHSLAIGPPVSGSRVVIETGPDMLNVPWTLTGPDGFVTAGTGDRTIGVSLAGNYTLAWGNVASYQKPATQTRALSTAGSITFSGTYTPLTGTIVLNAEPNGANMPGTDAPWTLTGPYSYYQQGTGDRTISGALVGQYNVAWGGISGWEMPSAASVIKTISAGQTVSVVGAYQKATGTVVISPQPASANAPWTLQDTYGYSLTGAGGATVTGRNSGFYSLTWGDAAGWVKPSPATLYQSMTPGGTVNFTAEYKMAGMLDHWQVQTMGSNGLKGVAYSPDLNLFAAVGNSGTILTSPDGDIWTPRSSGITSTLEKVVYGRARFVAVGSGGAIVTSFNGQTWNPGSSGTGAVLYGVACNNDLFVAVGAGGTILTSPDGISWSPASSGTINVLYGVGYGNGLFVALGAYGTILTSPNGVNWTPRDAGTQQWLWRVAHGHGTFVALGSAGLTAISADGMDWVPYAQGTGSFTELTDIRFVNGLFMAVGPNGTLLTSTAGEKGTWQMHPTGTTDRLESLAYGNHRLVMVGQNGTILRSDPFKGTAAIEVKPPGIDAAWNLTGPGGYNYNYRGDYHVILPETGDYTVTWGNVAKWRKPSPAQVTQTLADGGALNFRGNYVSSGTVVIDAKPDVDVDATAPWTLTGPNGFNQSGAGDATLDNLDSGSYTLTWKGLAGWKLPDPFSSTQPLAADETITFTGTYRLPVKGDVSGDDFVDLQDAIMVLQIMMGMQPPNVNFGGDVDGDGRIGLPEAIYILQKVAGMR